MPKPVANVTRGANCAAAHVRISPADCPSSSRCRLADLLACHDEQFLERLAHGFDRLGVVAGGTRDARQPLGGTRPAGRCSRSLANRLGDHPGAGREVRGRIDQDEAAGPAILGVAIEDDRPRRRIRHRADLIEHQPVIDFRRHGPGRVLQQVHAPGIERTLVHPDDVGAEPLADFDFADRQQVAAADVDFVLERQRHRLPGARHLQIAVPGDDPLDPRRSSARPGRHQIARPDRPRQNLAGVAAKLVGRPEHELHRHPERLAGDVAIDLDRLEKLEQRHPVEPRRPLAARDHVVAVQGADRNRMQVGVRQNPIELVDDVLEHRAIEVHQVHLVDREHVVVDAEQPGNLRVAPRLHAHAVARVDQQDRHVGGRRAGRHVAGVLLVAGRVGEDELAARRREVPVGDVDRDPLLALGPQTVGEERKIDRPGGPVLRRLLHRVQLILVDRPRVVEQPPDQRALPIVHAAGGADAEQTRHQK